MPERGYVWLRGSTSRAYSSGQTNNYDAVMFDQGRPVPWYVLALALDTISALRATMYTSTVARMQACHCIV
jgi:hypothetical protein